MKINKILHFSSIPIWVMNGKAGMPSVMKMLNYFDSKCIRQLYIYPDHTVKTLCKETLTEGITVIRIPSPNFFDGVFRKLPYAIQSKFDFLYYILFLSRFVHPIIKDFKPDIIYSHLFFPSAAIYSSCVRKYPVIVRLYGTMSFYDKIVRKKGNFNLPEVITPFLLDLDGYIMTNDGTNSDLLAKHFGIREDKILFKVNGSDKQPILSLKEKKQILDSLNIPNNAIIGIFVNRLNMFKGVDLLISTINKLDSVKEIYWIIIGDGFLASRLSEIKNYARVRWLKSIDNSLLFKYYQASTFLLSFNELSIMCNPVYEAIRAHIPIFALERGYGTEFLKNIVFTGKNENEVIDILLEKLSLFKNKDSAQYKMQEEILSSFEEIHLLTWEERYEQELKFLEKRLMACGKR